jgi:hypothetical protein
MSGWWRRHGSETAGARGREDIDPSNPASTLQAGQSDLFHIRVIRAIRVRLRRGASCVSSELGPDADAGRFGRCWYKEGASAVCCLMWAFRNEEPEIRSQELQARDGDRCVAARSKE